MAHDRPPRLFSIISWGCAATYWLTKVLTAHPEVLCLHNLRNQLSVVTGNAPLDEISYMKLIDYQGAPFRLSGDCHGIPLASVRKVTEHFGERFRAVVVTRHPVSRFLSATVMLKKQSVENYGDVFQTFLKQLDKKIMKSFKKNDELYLVRIMQMINRVTHEKEVGNIYPMEKLTKDMSELQNILSYLSDGELSFTEEMLESTFDGPVNVHRKTKKKKDPEFIFNNDFSSLQKELFSSLISPQARVVYEDLGYDLSFLN